MKAGAGAFFETEMQVVVHIHSEHPGLIRAVYDPCFTSLIGYSLGVIMLASQPTMDSGLWHKPSSVQHSDGVQVIS